MSIIELHGWKDLVIDTNTIFMLSARALKLYLYLIFRARGKGSAFPGVDRMVADLTNKDIADIESWSAPTIQRCIAELVNKHYIARKRRLGKSAVTIVFKTPADYDDWNESITHDRLEVSQMIDSIPSPMIEDKEYTGKDNKDKEYKEDSGALAPAPPSSPSTSQHPAVIVYKSVTNLKPKQVQRDTIVQRVSPEQVSKWHEVCTWWLLAGYSPTNVGGMLDKFSRYIAGEALDTYNRHRAEPQPRRPSGGTRFISGKYADRIER